MEEGGWVKDFNAKTQGGRGAKGSGGRGVRMRETKVPEESLEGEGGGEAVDMSGGQGAVYKPSDRVEQHFGPKVEVTGEGAQVTVTG